MTDRVAAVDPLIGLAISGSYVITSKIAEGGMGAVYLAVNRLGSKKVVKFLLAEYSRNPAIRERFDREARAAARLKGKPHIVAIDDVGELPDGQQWMVMEFLSGRTLESHLREHGRLAPNRAFYIFCQIARGLYELHLGGVIHRDLKPGNIFLERTEDEPYRVKLIDLGIAHDSMADSAGFKTQTGAAMGTPGYMAPEQYGDAGHVTSASDLYSLAIVMWEMLTGPGRLPWGYHDPRVLYHKQMTEALVFPAIDVPRGWREMLVSALAPRIEARPRSMYAFVAPLASELGPSHELALSGADMMARFLRPLMTNAPLVGETVRAPDPQAVAPVLYTPHRATVAPEPEPSYARPASYHAPEQPATVSQRPQQQTPVAPSKRITTLSASSGVALTADAAPPAKRWTFAVGLALCFAVFGMVFGVVYKHARQTGDEPGDSHAASMPSSAPAPSNTETSKPSAPPTTAPPAATTSNGSVGATTPSAPPPSALQTPAATPTAGAGSAAKASTSTQTPARPHGAPIAPHGTAANTAITHPTTPHAAAPEAGHGSATRRGSAFDPDAVE
jgi:eukaryotic-like serine/threonine-protein kinase